MPQSYAELYIHLVWATWDRHPLICPDKEPRIYDALWQECTNRKAIPVAIGGMPDHVHVLSQLPTTTSVADFVKQLKGVSSHFINHGLGMVGAFRWQGSYSVFSVSTEAVERVECYIKRQKEHHKANELYPEWELGKL